MINQIDKSLSLSAVDIKSLIVILSSSYITAVLNTYRLFSTCLTKPAFISIFILRRTLEGEMPSMSEMDWTLHDPWLYVANNMLRPTRTALASFTPKRSHFLLVLKIKFMIRTLIAVTSFLLMQLFNKSETFNQQSKISKGS